MTDVSTYPDLDPTFAWVSETVSIGQCAARRLETEVGQLIGCPEEGFPLVDFLGSSMVWHAVRAGVLDQVTRDERVDDATVFRDELGAADAFSLRIVLERADGMQPIRLTLSIDAVSAEVLLS